MVIESSNTFPEQPWEAQIWHNINTGNSTEWTALPLRRVPSTCVPLLNGRKTEYHYRRCVFTEDIAFPAQGGYAQFTVRFRTAPSADWQWVNNSRGGSGMGSWRLRLEILHSSLHSGSSSQYRRTRGRRRCHQRPQRRHRRHRPGTRLGSISRVSHQKSRLSRG